MLGSLQFAYGPSLLNGGIHVTQLFATGLAARTLSTNPSWGSVFGIHAVRAATGLKTNIAVVKSEDKAPPASTVILQTITNVTVTNITIKP